MYYDEDDNYNAYDDYDRHMHTGEFPEWFEDEQEVDEDTFDDCCDDTAPGNHMQAERENKKERDSRAGCLPLVMIAIVIAAILITKF